MRSAAFVILALVVLTAQLFRLIVGHESVRALKAERWERMRHLDDAYMWLGWASFLGGVTIGAWAFVIALSACGERANAREPEVGPTPWCVRVGYHFEDSDERHLAELCVDREDVCDYWRGLLVKYGGGVGADVGECQ